MTGFTYNGVHCSDFGLYYIPTRDDQWFSDPEYDTYDIDMDWRHGGYYYDSKAKVRTFTIKCYFEEISIATRQAIKNWLRRDSRGELMFDDKPFVYWNVHPGKIPVGNWYIDNNEKHSGTVTIVFNAYEPFGYLTRKSGSIMIPPDHSEEYVNFIDPEDMPDDPTTSGTSFDIYNPGTENCGLSISVSGSTENPIRFFNENNGTFCSFESLPAGGLIVGIDGNTGYVSAHMPNSTSYTNGFAYHDKGVIQLAPNVGRSDVSYRYIGKNGTYYVLELIGYDATNMLDNATVKVSGLNTTLTIESVSSVLNRINCSAESSVTVPSSGTCSIYTLNHILVEEKNGAAWVAPYTLQLTSIAVDYDPRAM